MASAVSLERCFFAEWLPNFVDSADTWYLSLEEEQVQHNSPRGILLPTPQTYYNSIQRTT